MALNLGALRNEWNKLRDALPSKAEVNKILEPARKEWDKLRDALPSKAEIKQEWDKLCDTLPSRAEVDKALEPVRKEWNDVKTTLTQTAQEILDKVNAKLDDSAAPENQASEPLTYEDPSQSAHNQKEL